MGRWSLPVGGRRSAALRRSVMMGTPRGRVRQRPQKSQLLTDSEVNAVLVEVCTRLLQGRATGHEVAYTQKPLLEGKGF